MIEYKCKCGVTVVDGQNGSVSTAPWSPDPEVCCYACENKAMGDAEREQGAESALAAMRAGRFDCV